MKTNKRKLGLYSHIPFCAQKCSYCDFLSYVNEDRDARTHYVSKLTQEIAGKSLNVRDSHVVDSIFVGGGTPSVLDVNLIEEIIDTIYSTYKLSSDIEITIEANPGTLNFEKLNALKSIGFNRISMGVQSFNNDVLKTLGRIHDSKTAIDSYNKARAAGFSNINLDLMFGIPGETSEIWEKDISTMKELDPEHVSFYSLQVEEGTRIFHRIMDGDVEEVDEIIDRKMYHHALEELKKAGFVHYEISNAAKPGFESRHNLKYWSLGDYLGFGLGAHSYINSRRMSNTEILKDYLSAESSASMTVWQYENTVNDEISEFVFLGLRKTKGISLGDFSKIFRKDFLDIYDVETEDLMKRGLLEIKEDHIKLTDLGRDVSNKVFSEFV